MPNYASGAKKKKKPKEVPTQGSGGGGKSGKTPVDAGQMAKFLAKKKANKAADKAAMPKQKKKSAKEVLAEYNAREAERRRKDNEEKERLAKAAAEKAREAALAAARRRAALEKTVDQLSAEEDGPQTIAQCVARTLGIQGAALKPKEILRRAAEQMAEVALDESLPPKAQLMQLVAVLVERRAAKRAAEAARLSASKAAVRAKQEEQAAAGVERSRQVRGGRPGPGWWLTGRLLTWRRVLCLRRRVLTRCDAPPPGRPVCSGRSQPLRRRRGRRSGRQPRDGRRIRAAAEGAEATTTQSWRWRRQRRRETARRS
jgi:hypothetical protein